MAGELRFDGKVAIVTGAGGGLGRSHALLLASRGARVVVNDLGGDMHGGGGGAMVADKVVAEIKELGGEAVANYDSVEEGHRIVETAMDAFGAVDIVINNAGILRDVSFHKLTDDDWDLIYRVHVLGTYKVTHAAWMHMRSERYGRIVNTASAAGIYGNFGQTNYAMAKLGILGFSNALAVEGKKRNIHVNTIAPIAGSRMTETVLPKEVVDALQPEYVSPLVAWLCHEDCKETGGTFEVGGGFYAKLRWQRSEGRTWRLGRKITVDDVADAWGDIAGFEKTTYPTTVMESMQPIMGNLEDGPSKGGNKFIDVDQALGYEFPAATSTHDERDLALYALSVGAAQNPLDNKGLRYVYEMHGEGMVALPSYGVIPALNTYMNMMKEGQQAPGLNYGLDRVLHGEQNLEILHPLPVSGTLTHKARIKDIFDKGKGALVITEIESSNEDGVTLMRNEITTFVRGAGGWGGDRGSSEVLNTPPERDPDAVAEQVIPSNAALLYRLTGDWNPLHADPDFARNFGFDQPILHGLCTFGYAVRHVIDHFAPGGDSNCFKSVKVRFADSVFPGETVVTQMWQESPTRVVFQASIKERDSKVITQAAVEFYAEPAAPAPKPEPTKADNAEAAAAGPAEITGADVMTAVGEYLGQNTEVAGKVKTVYQMRLKDPASVWTMDLSSPPGAVASGATVAPQCTLEMTDADLVAMATGEADAMKLFSTGKLKISGDIMASQKLGFLAKMPQDLIQSHADKRAGSGGGDDAKDAPITSWDIFMGLGVYFESHPELTQKVGKIFLFKLTDPDSSWTMDLKAGKVIEGDAGNAECTLQLSDANYMAMVQGEADPMKLFSTGKLKISGDIMASQKLTFLQKLDRAEMEKAVMEARAEHGGPRVVAEVEPERQAQAPAVFAALAKRLGDNAELAAEVQATINFVVKDPDAAWTVNLRDGASVTEGASDNADTTITITDEELGALAGADGNLRAFYQKGRMRIDGDVAAAGRLTFIKGLI